MAFAEKLGFEHRDKSSLVVFASREAMREFAVSPRNKLGATMSYWSKITDIKTARDAVMQGVGASVFVAAVTGLIAILSIVFKHPVLGIDGWALVDAGLFGVIAWRTYRMSRPWALVGLLLYVVELAIRVKNGLVPIAGLVVAFFI